MPSWRRPSTRPGTSLRRAQGDRKSYTTLFRAGVTRLAYSYADRDGREYVLGLMRDAKLAPTIDAAGNIIATRPGRDPSRKPILFGSHIDSVPEGGNYDGDVGSLSAIEVGQVLDEKGDRNRHPLEVALWW